MEGTAKILKDRVIARTMPSVYINSVRILTSAKGDTVQVLQKIINSSDIVWYLVELEDSERGYLVGSVLDVDAVPLERPDTEPPPEEGETTDSMTVMLSLLVIAYTQMLVPSPDDQDRMIIRFEPQIFYEEQEVTLPVYQIDPAANAEADEPDHQRDETESMEFDPDSPD